MDDAQEQGFRKDLFARVAILLEDLPIWRKHGDIATQLHPLRVSRAVVMQRQSLLSIDALALAMAAEITTNITMSLIGEKRQIREENQAAMKAYARYFTSAADPMSQPVTVTETASRYYGTRVRLKLDSPKAVPYRGPEIQRLAGLRRRRAATRAMAMRRKMIIPPQLRWN